jgi:prepilin-type N-terminal cleavage/methylation domain-containing protein
MVTPLRLRESHSPRPVGQGNLGVTLLELMVVIVMIGILAAIAMSKLDWKRYQADAAGRGTMAELATTQRLALSLQANLKITFPDSTRMKILEDANNDGLASSGERVRYVVLDNNFYFGKATAPNLPSPEDATTITSITFHRDGSADKSGTVYLHGPGADASCKRCRAIAINRATGRVVWYTYGTGSWKRGN